MYTQACMAFTLPGCYCVSSVTLKSKIVQDKQTGGYNLLVFHAAANPNLWVLMGDIFHLGVNKHEQTLHCLKAPVHWESPWCPTPAQPQKQPHL